MKMAVQHSRWVSGRMWPLMAALSFVTCAVPMDASGQLGPLERFVMPGPVVEAHAEHEQVCVRCHVRFQRESQRMLCLDCHVEIADDLVTGTGFHSLSPAVGDTECATCHTDHEGRGADILGLDEASFDHELTDFPLRGEHAQRVCVDCHAADATFHAAETECYSCHMEDDPHRGNLGEACADCHSETAWTDVTFDHDSVTGYPLTGAHAATTCVSCHVEQRYESTPDTCIGCHRDDDTHLGTNGPTCQDCHSTQNWQDVLFDHFVRSGFALDGAHSDLTCESCHEGNKLEQQPPTACYGCHQEDDTHDGVNGTVCNDCHRVTEWLDVTFDHARDADFALNGAHAELECASCHLEPVAAALPATGCFGCHAEDDPHESQLGEQCATCHSEIAWTQSLRFDHDLTRFPLLGRHAETVCEDCHASHAYLDAPEQCIDCHREDDAHERRLGQDCGLCHNPNDWLVWRFDHDRQTDFLLDGAHDDLECLACHRQPVDGAIRLDASCGSCHRGDDVHRGEFGFDCAQCHTTESFRALRELQ
jgi:hypothetical protein